MINTAADHHIAELARRLVKLKAEARKHKADFENTNRRIVELEIELHQAVELSESHTV